MTAIAAANVTYTIKNRVTIPRKHLVEVQIVFGNGTLTYPSGGIPLTVFGLGLFRNCENIVVMDSGADGYLYNAYGPNLKIRIFNTTYTSGASYAQNFVGPGLELAGAATPAATTLQCMVTGW